jgi:TRAP-type transport system periplasmic protein
MKRQLLIAGAGLLALGVAANASAETVLKYGVSNIPGGLQFMTGEEFTRRANERLPKDYRVEFYGSSQLGNDKEMMQKLKLGTVHFSMPSSIMTSIVPEFGLFDLPFLVQDRAHLNRIEHAVVWPKLAPLAEEKGYKILAFVENGFRQITNNVRPIVKPEDLKGVKLRTPRGVWRVKMFEAWGANPTPMAFSEVFVALQTGTIDGQENPLSNIYGGKFQEVQKYLSMTGHVYSPSFIAMGKKYFDDLPADIRATIVDVARSVQGWAYAVAITDENKLYQTLTDAGMQANEADKKAFVAASASVYEQFAAEVPAGKELIATALALAD